MNEQLRVGIGSLIFVGFITWILILFVLAKLDRMERILAALSAKPGEGDKK